MALKRAAGGGGDFLNFLELAQARTLVVFRVLELLPDEQMPSSVVQPVRVDVLICSGPEAGAVYTGEKVIGKGITSTLRRAYDPNEQVNDVAARLEAMTTGRVEWAAAQTPSDPEFAAIEKVYRDGAAFVPANGAPVGAGSGRPPF